MKIVFRVEGSSLLGLGHIYTTLRIIEEIQGKILMIQGTEDYCLDTIKLYQPDVVINNIPFISWIYLDRLKKFTPKIINIVDSRFDLDLDCNVGMVISFLDQPEITPISLEFSDLPKKKFNDKVTKILITFGGGDPRNYTQRIINELQGMDFQITAVLGPGYRHPKPNKNSNVVLREAVDDKVMAQLFYDHDIAICSGGMTVWELAATGTPALVIPQNSREAHRIEAFIQRHQTCCLYNLENFKVVLNDKNLRQRISKKGMNLVDGKGTLRLAKKIEECIKDHSS